MESAFPRSTLVVALCVSTFSLLAHTAGLAAYRHKKEAGDKGTRTMLRRQIVFSAIMFCSILTALFIAEFPNINASPKLPLAWYFTSVVFAEGDRRQLMAYKNNMAETSERRLSLGALFIYIRPLPLFYAAAASHYYSLLTFVPIIVEFAISCYEKVALQHRWHFYRCPTAAFSMLAFLIASLITSFREIHQSGLILGLALNVLLLLTFPFQEIWSEHMWAWFGMCFRSLRQNMARGVLSSGTRLDSTEELRDLAIREPSTGSLPGDLDSVGKCTDDFQSHRLDEEHGVETAR